MTLLTFSTKVRNWLAEERIEGYQVNCENDIIRISPDTIVTHIVIEKLIRLCNKYELLMYITINYEIQNAQIVIFKK